MNELEELQKWYLGQCDEDWEHSYGISIETLDNPGWIITIDLVDTELENIVLERVISRKNEHDWVQYEIHDNKFIGCGGPLNLNEMIKYFLSIAKTNSKDCC